MFSNDSRALVKVFALYFAIKEQYDEDIIDSFVKTVCYLKFDESPRKFKDYSKVFLCAHAYEEDLSTLPFKTLQ